VADKDGAPLLSHGTVLTHEETTSKIKDTQEDKFKSLTNEASV